MSIRQTAFKTLATIKGGPQVGKFLDILPFLKRIDNRVDKQSPEEWLRYGAAGLGDKPCEFLQNLMDNHDFRTVGEQIKSNPEDMTRQFKQDVWQVYNLLAMQLQAIGEASAKLRNNPGDIDARRQLVEEHEHLSVLATLAGAHNAGDLARDLRDLAKTHGNNLQEIYPLFVKGKTIQIGKSQLPADEFGAVNQIIDDANDLIGDLVSEVKQGRINPNRFILRMLEKNISPAEFLHDLQEKHKQQFKNPKGRLRGKDLGEFRQVIQEELNRYPASLQECKEMCAIKGISINADSFPTYNDDHNPASEGTLDFTGTMGWAERAKALVASGRRGNISKS